VRSAFGQAVLSQTAQGLVGGAGRQGGEPGQLQALDVIGGQVLKQQRLGPAELAAEHGVAGAELSGLPAPPGGRGDVAVGDAQPVAVAGDTVAGPHAFVLGIPRFETGAAARFLPVLG
jgi:hypothetical protein